MSMPMYHFGETYSAARTIPSLVGRKESLPQIKAAIYATKPSVLVYIYGAGGVGKTRIIQHLLAEAQGANDLLVADELIDLYHTRNRSVGGLAESIVEVLEPLRRYIRSRPANSEIDEKLEALAHAEQEGLSTSELISRRQELSNLLVETVNQYSAERRLLLALDTAERLYIVEDEAQQRLGLTNQRPAVLDWLLHDFLPKLQNATVLIAGRPNPLNLTAELSALAVTAHQRFLPIPLAGLTEADTMDYFDVVISRARESDNPNDKIAAAAIRRWSDEQKRTIFYCLHDGGDDPRIRPILLALAIDHLAVEGMPLPSLRRSLKDAKALNEGARREIETELGKAMVRTLREHQRPADEVIVMLGWLRKGADLALLQRLTEYEPDKIEEIVQQIRHLSFVKIRPADNRIFLHDEMYDILQRHTLVRATPDDRQLIFATLQAYYADLIKVARIHIDELYHPQADRDSEPLPDPNEVRNTRARLHDAIIDDLYYRLRWQPTAAFEQYIFYAEEALASNEESLWAMLRAELFGFLGEENPFVSPDEVTHLRNNYVVPDSAVRWVMWLWSRDQYQEGAALAERIQREHFDLIAPGGKLIQWYLQVWQGYLYAYTGKYEAAEVLLKEVVRALASWCQAHPLSRLGKGTLARAYNALGYYFSVRTQHYQAIKAFAGSVELMHELQLYVDEAATLNNRAFDLAKIGDYAAALPSAKAALVLREQLGPRAPVGLSLNTLGLIELMQFDLEGGNRDIKRAVELFESLNSARGLGLALIALAEAVRRISVSVVYRQQSRSANFLVEAIAHADRAIKIFQVEIPEPTRLIQALQEKARSYRDWAKLRQEYPAIVTPQEKERGKQTVEELARQSQAIFEEAKKLIGQDPIALIDLLYDQALLVYYTQLYTNALNYLQVQSELEKTLLAQIDQLIPAEYKALPGPGAKRVWHWVQQGNLALLRGHLAFNHWNANRADDTSLRLAVGHYTFALDYYAYFSKHNFQERRQSLDELYEQLRPLSTKQKQRIHEFVHDVEQEQALAPHTSAMSETSAA